MDDDDAQGPVRDREALAAAARALRASIARHEPGMDHWLRLYFEALEPWMKAAEEHRIDVHPELYEVATVSRYREDGVQDQPMALQEADSLFILTLFDML